MPPHAFKITMASLLILIVMHCEMQAQWTVDPHLDKKYDYALHQLHPYLQDIVFKWDSIQHQHEPNEPLNHVYVTRIEIDTLNKDSVTFIDLSGIKILSPSVDDATNAE